MRRIFCALTSSLLLFVFLRPANADPIQYTLTNNIYANGHGTNLISILDGTFVFTLPSLMTTNTVVWAPDHVDLGPEFRIPGYTYITAPDFTRPDGSHVNELMFTLASYGYVVQIDASPGPGLAAPIGYNYSNPNLYDSGGSHDLTLAVNDLAASPVPEPSTMAMIGSGVLAFVAGTKRQRSTRL